MNILGNIALCAYAILSVGQSSENGIVSHSVLTSAELLHLFSIIPQWSLPRPSFTKCLLVMV